MEVLTSDDAYLKYDDYIKLKNKFKSNAPYSSSTLSFEQLLNYANIQDPKRTKLSIAFSELLRHINDDFLFLWGDNVGACKYIRYMLQKLVEVDLSQSYDLNTVKMFENFLNKYGENFTSKQNRCISKIDPIDSTTFKKMGALYRLYDEYSNYSGYDVRNMHLVCDMFHKLIRAYNSYMDDNKSKSELFNLILENFSTNVKRTVSDFTLQCSDYHYDLISPKLYNPKPVINVETPIPAKERETELPSRDAKLQSSAHEALDSENTQLPHEVTKPESIPQKTLRAETHRENDSHRETSNHHAVHNHSTEIDAITETPSRIERPQVVFGSLRTQLQPQHQEYVQTQHPEYLNPQDLSNEAARSSPTIIGSITSALKEVDPVPVVGVSGGMGALFLLFRYTPVGAFFRGGRGRVRRIPSGFHGQFLGEFPDIQDYYGGYIGYSQMSSLAE